MLANLVTALLCANGLGDHGEDLYTREKLELGFSGYARMRGGLLDNLDRDRGLTPSGRPLYPVPQDGSQLLETADLRVRTDVALYAPFAAAAVKVRADLIDDLTLGSTPILSNGYGASPTPSAQVGSIPNTLLRIKRAYGEVVT